MGRTKAKDSNIIRFPQPSKSVRTALKEAVRKAFDQRWTKILVIGLGKEEGHYCHNKLDAYTLIGMIEDMKYVLTKDRFSNTDEEDGDGE